MGEVQQIEIGLSPQGLRIYFRRHPDWSFVLDARNRVALVQEPGLGQFAVRFASLRSLVYRVAAGELVLSWRRPGEGGGEDRQRWPCRSGEIWKLVTDFIAAHPMPGVVVEQVR